MRSDSRSFPKWEAVSHASVNAIFTSATPGASECIKVRSSAARHSLGVRIVCITVAEAHVIEYGRSGLWLA